jgi:hypothetical protein
MVEYLRQLTSRLSETVGAWDEFQGSETGYFLDRSPTASSRLRLSVAAVVRSFAELRALQQQLERLRKDLCEGNPQGVSHLLYL